MEQTVSALFGKYLAWCGKHRSPRTQLWYSGHLNGFLRHLGENASLPVASLKPYHIVEWVDAQDGWGDTYKRGAIVAVQRAFNWAADLGYIETNPVRKIAKPPAGRRDNPMPVEHYEAMLSHLPEGDPFRDLLVFLWHTGARPQEARHIEPRHVQLDLERIVLPKHEAKGKRYPRTIYLAGPALEIIGRLMAKRREGKLFRNARGGPWEKFAVANRMDRLSEKIGTHYACYDIRHSYATRKLIQGHDHLTVAQLLGHRDGTMLARVYGHLDRHSEHLKKALED